MLCRFMVSPLTEDCGIIEWVPHTCALRAVLNELYAAAGHDRSTLNKLKTMYDRHQV